MKKIGLIGAGGTGKSSVAALLALELGVPYVKGVVRPIMAERGLTEHSFLSMTVAEVWDFQRDCFTAKIQQDTEIRGVNDRTLADHYAYCLFRCASVIPVAMAKSMEKLVDENLKKYDALYFFPLPPWDPVPDPVRDDGLAYRYAMDAMMRGLLARLGVNYKMIQHGQSPEETVSWILRGRGLGANTSGRGRFAGSGGSGQDS